MTSHLTVAEVLAQLEAQMAHHQAQAAHHADQEVFHRERKEAHTAEYETVARHYEAFKATAGVAVELAARTAAPPPAPSPLQELGPGQPVLRSRLVARVVADLPVDQTFTASGLAAEVNRRYGPALRKPDARLASAALRRLLAKGVIRLAQKGTARREARYVRASATEEKQERRGSFPKRLASWGRLLTSRSAGGIIPL